MQRPPLLLLSPRAVPRASQRPDHVQCSLQRSSAVQGVTSPSDPKRGGVVQRSRATSLPVLDDPPDDPAWARQVMTSSRDEPTKEGVPFKTEVRVTYGTRYPCSGAQFDPAARQHISRSHRALPPNPAASS